MTSIRAKIGENGRIVLPAQYRKELALEPGDDVILLLQGEEVRLLTPAAAVRRAQSIVRRHVAPERRLSEELITERRTEATGE